MIFLIFLLHYLQEKNEILSWLLHWLLQSIRWTFSTLHVHESHEYSGCHDTKIMHVFIVLFLPALILLFLIRGSYHVSTKTWPFSFAQLSKSTQSVFPHRPVTLICTPFKSKQRQLKYHTAVGYNRLEWRTFDVDSGNSIIRNVSQQCTDGSIHHCPFL
jgi:hypothetical protein